MEANSSPPLVRDIHGRKVAAFPWLFAWTLALLTLAAGGAGAQDSGPYFVTRWACATPGPNNYSYGVRVGPGGRVYVSDYVGNQVRVYEPDGTPGPTIGSRGSGPGQLFSPHGLAFTTAGELVVADTDNHRIEIFDGSGAYLRAFGSWGTANGFFRSPVDVAVDAAGRIWVSDANNHRVQVFDADGTWRLTVGGPGSAPGQFAGPRGIAFLASGDAVIADEGNSRVQVFSAAGLFVGAWPLPWRGLRPGPRGVTVDPQGRVLVADSGGSVIEVFAPSGSVLSTWGRGDWPPLLSPFGWALDCSPGGMIYLAGLSCDVNVFALDRAVPSRRSSWGAVKAIYR